MSAELFNLYFFWFRKYARLSLRMDFKDWYEKQPSELW
jgi:hypothetical protein